MSRITPFMPFRERAKMNIKALLWAVPTSLVFATEVKDMYYRATWEVVPVPPSSYETGDVIAIANRWYTLPTVSSMVRCLMVKTMLRCSWDDLGVIVVRQGVPYIVLIEDDRVVDMPLETFVEQRQPRGAAWRKLHVEPGFQKPTTEIAEIFLQEVKRIAPSPWYIFSASQRTAAETKFYAFETEFCSKKAEYRASVRALKEEPPNRHGTMIARDDVVAPSTVIVKSRKALESMEKRLKEMDVMRQHLASLVEPSVTSDHEFKLFSGSLVASFIATFGLLDREMPSVSRYVPQDFTYPLPFKGASLGTPYIVFKG